MGSVPGVLQQEAVKAFQKVGYRVIRQGKHIILSDGLHTVVIPRNNPINAFTMATIINGSGLTIEQFRKLL